MSEKPYRPRLSIELTDEQAKDLRDHIPWGIKNALFQVIVDDVIKAVKEHGQIFIAALLERKIRLNKLVKFEVKDE